KRPAPSYHWEGFGRKNTKPPWFNCRVYDKERRDVGWVIKDYGAPSAIDKPGRHGAAPFVHSADSRLYRPTVPFEGSLSVEVPATPSSRVMVPRDVEAAGCKGKLVAMREASRHSHMQMLANMHVSRRSELRETIIGRGATIQKALLYPQTVTHQQALNLEKKAGPSLPFDAAPPPPSNRRESRFEPLNQHMYLPYSRTRADFPGLAPLLAP
ncbi:unnamed protein product, partial [Laminaria digitata]